MLSNQKTNKVKWWWSDEEAKRRTRVRVVTGTGSEQVRESTCEWNFRESIPVPLSLRGDLGAVEKVDGWL